MHRDYDGMEEGLRACDCKFARKEIRAVMDVWQGKVYGETVEMWLWQTCVYSAKYVLVKGQQWDGDGDVNQEGNLFILIV